MSDSILHGYKMTEFGIIPDDWDEVTLDSATIKVGSGITPRGGSNVYQAYGRPFVRSQNVGWGILSLEDLAFISDEIHATFDATEIQLDDVFLNITGASIGRSAIADERVVNGNVNQHVCIIRTMSEKLHPRYLNYFLLSNMGQSQIDSFQAGGNRQGLNFGQIRSFHLVIPPTLTEQRAIADALSDVDERIIALDEAITKKRDLKQGTMQRLLTGEERLPGFGEKVGYKQSEVGIIPEDWNVITLESITPTNKRYGIVDGPFGSNLKTIHYRKSGIPIITSGYVTEGIFSASDYLYVDEEKFKQEQRSAVHGGDIIMAKIGVRCGASAILPSNHDIGILSGNALKITVNEERYSTHLVWQVLWNLYLSGEIDVLKTVGAQPAISIERLKVFKISLPSTLYEQRAIATVLTDMDEEISILEVQREKTVALKKGMMQELLTGKTRLV